MQTAPELIFHDVDRSAWVESYILERVQRLERFADGITSCRVTLTQEQASHHKGNRYSVMVEKLTSGVMAGLPAGVWPNTRNCGNVSRSRHLA